MPNKKRNYIDKVQFYNELKSYRKIYDDAIEAGLEPPVIPRYIAQCFMDIGRNFAKKHNYYEYTWKDEMIAEGLLDCVKYWHSFDPEKSVEAFSYFTQYFSNAFSRKLNDEKKHKYVKFRTCLNKGIFGEYSNFIDESEDDDGQSSQRLSYENITNYVSDYEAKLDQKKVENKEKLKANKIKNSKVKTLF